MKKMRVLFLAHNCRAGGGRIIVFNLLQAMDAIGGSEEYLAICPDDERYRSLSDCSNIQTEYWKHDRNIVRRYWKEKVRLPQMVMRLRPDVLVGLGNIGLPSIHVPQALLFHQPKLIYDARHYPHAPMSERFRVAALTNMVKRSLPTTNLVFCQTPVVRDRFASRFQFSSEKIAIIRFPVPAELVQETDQTVPAVIQERDGFASYLVLTRYLTHRNPTVLISLCRKFGDELRAKKIYFITTISQSDHPHAPGFLRQISRFRLQDIIVNVGSLNRTQVSAYFAHSTALLSPTLIETLGFSYLEAMHFGKPILTPALDFSQYVCGDAAEYYDPWRMDSLYESVVKLAQDSTRREQLAERGKEELQNTDKFSPNWNVLAESVMQEIRDIL